MARAKRTKRAKRPAARRKASSKKAPSVRIRRVSEKRAIPSMRVKVVGVGGGGGNAVSRMSRSFARGVEFIAINTDHQDLDHASVRRKIYIGKNLTGGMGAGMNPDLGRQAAEENRSEIAEALKGADLVFVTAGLGGGTGSGAAPIVAEAAKQSGALTFAVVTKPFAFEGTQRERIASESVGKIKEKVDALIVVPNDKVFSVIDKDTPLLRAFAAIDDILRNALLGVVELIGAPGLINVDFADVKAIVQEAGSAVVGVGTAQGQGRAEKAVKAALFSPLLEINAEGARGVILGISGGKDLKMSEVHDAARLVAQAADPSAKIIFGAYHDRSMKQNQIKVTLVATGFDGTAQASSLFTGRRGEPAEGMFASFSELKEGPEEVVSGKEPASKAASSKSGKKGDTAGKGKKTKDEEEEEYPWDIPAFLRRKK